MRRARHVQQPVRALEIAVILRLPRMSGGFPPCYMRAKAISIYWSSYFYTVLFAGILGISTLAFIFWFYR